MKRNLFLLVLLLCVGLTETQAQPKWLVKPGTYDQISFLSNNLLKVKKDGRVGVIDNQGNEILPTEYDSIFPMYQGVAIATKYKAPHWYVGGTVIDDNNKVTSYQFAATYSFWYEKYPFFSEGYLVVVDTKTGCSGYMDVRGKLLGGSTSLQAAAPFSEGLAWVKYNNQLFYMDKNCQRHVPEFGGVVYYARTNFKNGQAIIEDEFGNMYFTNRNFSSRSKFNGYLETDYLFRYDASRNTLLDFPVDKISYNNTAPEPYKKNDLYGYRSLKEVFILPQFRNVSKFVKDVAIVENTKGKPGVITARNGYSMGYCTVVPVQKNIYAQRGHNAFIQFNVNEDESNVPIETMAVQHLSGKNSDLLDWNPINDTRYSATFTPTAEGENVFAVYFFSEDGFLVSENLLTYNFQYAAPLDYDINVGQASASSPHTVPVNVVISNPNSVSMSLDYDLLGSEGFHCDNSSGTISVPANGKYTLRGSFSVSKSVSGAWVILESNKETLAKRTNISMHSYVAPREKETPKKENKKEEPEKKGPKIVTDDYTGNKPVIHH